MPLAAHGRDTRPRGRWARLRARSAEESGAMLVITAVMLVALIGLAALAIDVGSFYQAQRQAQAAADSGALAGADALAGGASAAAASATATSMASTNYPSTTVPTAVVSGTSITVNVANTTPAYFGRILGVTSEKVGARAVAVGTQSQSACASPGSNCYAVFAMDQTCTSSSTPFTGGGGITINGGLHSNGSLNFGGGGSNFGQVTYGTGCPLLPAQWNQNSNTFTPSTNNPIAQAPTTIWPLNYALDFPACAPTVCTGPCADGSGTCANSLRTPSWCSIASNAASWSIDTYTKPYTLSSGNIYCGVGTGTPGDPSTWNGVLQANGGPATVTLIAGSIKFGGGTNLTACGYRVSGFNAATCSEAAPLTTNYPVAYATTGGINDSSGGATFTGDMYAPNNPNGLITIGGGVTVTSFLEGYDVNWSSGGITGDGPDSSGTSTSGTGSASLTQ